MQQIAKEFYHTVICVFGIAEHVKSQVDHVEGIAKVAVHQEIVSGELFTSACKIADFILGMFGEKDQPKYRIYKLKADKHEENRRTNTQRTFKTVRGSASFHVRILSQNSLIHLLNCVLFF